MEKVSRISAYLPDPLVGFLPLDRSGVSHLNQKVACGLVELPKLVAKEANRAEEFSINVELALLPGAVADAYRLAGPPSSQVAERALAEIMLTADSEHDLQSSVLLELGGHRTSHPVEEARRFIGQAATHSAPSVRLASRTQVYR